MRVDLHKLPTCEKIAQSDDKFLSEGSAQAGLSSARRSMEEDHSVAANNVRVNPADREVKHGKGIVEQVPLHRPVIHQAFPDSLQSHIGKNQCLGSWDLN